MGGREHPVEEQTIHVEGALDGILARRIEAVLVEAGPGDRIRIDLTLTTELSDFVIAVLAEALTRSRATVELRGLGPHRLGALARLGLDITALERALH